MTFIRKLCAAAGTATMLLGLTACQTNTDADATARATSPVAQAGICDGRAAEALVGTDRITDEQAMQLTGATKVRQIAPGAPVTMDYLPERVTIETDESTSRIVRALCG